MEMAASSTHQESKTESKKLGSSRPTLTVPPRNSTEAFLKGSDAATPSPLTFVSSLFADQDPYAGDVMSFSQLLAGAIASPSATHLLGDGLMKPIGFSSTPDGNPPSSSGGHASAELPPCSHAAKFKSMMPPRLPIRGSPLLTIPPGLSPTYLLDSPIFFPMGLAEPSPTTSTFFFSPLIYEGGFTSTFMSGNDKDGSSGQDGSPTFTFKAHPQLPNSPLASMGPYGLSHQQALAQVQAQAHSLVSIGAETSAIEGTPTVPAMSGSVSDSPEVLSHSVGLLEPAEETAIERSSPSHDVSTSHPLPHLVERPSEDGYNWRKYGQKQVKGSEYPRAYYKCTHPGCAVKKKVERSYGGQITEIVYKGEHNHAKPQCTRRPATSNAHVTNGLGRDFSQSRSGVTLETSGCVNDRGQLAGGVGGTPEPSLNSLSNDEAEDGGDDHSGSKRMRLEKAAGPAANPPLSTVKEPRVVVQTTSDIDILDDGYRWRKYGRKVVKGNPYPRSYYRCTSSGCTVRKHVERSSSNPKSVITTYEGKHNHAVPQTRNSSSNGPPAAATSTSSEPMRQVLLGSDPKGRGVKGAISLQEQVFGRMFVEGHKTETSMETSSTHGRSMHKALMDDQSKMEGGTEAYLTLAECKMGSGHFEEALGFRPKEELSQEVIIL